MECSAGREEEFNSVEEKESVFATGFGERSDKGRLLARADVFGRTTQGFDRPGEISGDHVEFVVGELLQMLPARFQHGYKRLPYLLGASGIEMDHDPAAILYIALAADEIEPFQSIDEPRDRAC